MYFSRGLLPVASLASGASAFALGLTAIMTFFRPEWVADTFGRLQAQQAALTLLVLTAAWGVLVFSRLATLRVSQRAVFGFAAAAMLVFGGILIASPVGVADWLDTHRVDTLGSWVSDAVACAPYWATFALGAGCYITLARRTHEAYAILKGRVAAL